MTVPKITATEFENQLRAGITNRDNTQDTGYGPVKDIVITPVAQVIEQQNDRLRSVSQLMSLENADQFTEADLDALVFNEDLVRDPGDQSVGTVIFSRSSAPTVDCKVQRGFPIATSPDESTGKAVTFMTSEARTLPTATAASYFNLDTQRYELSVPVIALVQGADGKVGPNRITRPLRPLVNFDSVTNADAVTSGGVPSETNVQLTERYQISVEGRQLSTPKGIVKYVKDGFPGVVGISTVYGSNPLLTRSATDAGAVDVFVIAEQTTQVVDNLTFLGIGQLLPLSTPPLVNIVSVKLGATTLVEDTDYEVVYDDSGVSSSSRAIDGIRILATTAIALIPGSSILVVTYTYNPLVRDLQADSLDEEVFVFGRDLLYRMGVQVPIVFNATLTTASGFSGVTVAGFVQIAIVAFINGLGLGATVEAFDLERVAGQVSGTDNFVITRLTRATVASGVDDVPTSGKEYPRITTANCVITPA